MQRHAAPCPSKWSPCDTAHSRAILPFPPDLLQIDSDEPGTPAPRIVFPQVAALLLRLVAASDNAAERRAALGMLCRLVEAQVGGHEGGQGAHVCWKGSGGQRGRLQCSQARAAASQ